MGGGRAWNAQLERGAPRWERPVWGDTSSGLGARQGAPPGLPPRRAGTRCARGQPTPRGGGCALSANFLPGPVGTQRSLAESQPDVSGGCGRGGQDVPTRVTFSGLRTPPPRALATGLGPCAPPAPPGCTPERAPAPPLGLDAGSHALRPRPKFGLGWRACKLGEGAGRVRKHLAPWKRRKTVSVPRGAAGKQRILSRCSGPQELMHKPQKVFREGTPPPPPRLMTPTEPALFVVSPFLKGKWGSCCAWCQQLTPSERWFPGSCALFRTGPTGEWTRFRNERRDGRPGLCGGAFPSVGNLAQHQGAGLCVPGSWLLWGVHLLMDFTACTLEMVLSVADFREN